MSEKAIVKNSLGGDVPLETIDVFIGRYTDDFSRKSLERALLRKGVAGAVMFQNLQMDSRHHGQLAAVTFGPGCTYKTVEELCSQRLGTTPSTFQYPVAYIVQVSAR